MSPQTSKRPTRTQSACASYLRLTHVAERLDRNPLVVIELLVGQRFSLGLLRLPAAAAMA